MLVLTRKHQEQIRVGDNITITILKVKGNSVRIGIEAPREVRVIRGELPTFEALEQGESVDATAGELPADSSVADGTGEAQSVSELEWTVMRKLGRRRACLPVRRCLTPATHQV